MIQHPNNLQVELQAAAKPFIYNVQLTVESDKPIKNVTDVFSGRIWSVDGVRPTVTARLLEEADLLALSKAAAPSFDIIRDPAKMLTDEVFNKWVEDQQAKNPWIKKLDHAMEVVERILEGVGEGEGIHISIDVTGPNGLSATIKLD